MPDPAQRSTMVYESTPRQRAGAREDYDRRRQMPTPAEVEQILDDQAEEILEAMFELEDEEPQEKTPPGRNPRGE